MVILASRRVEATNNTFENNNSVDIAIINGLAIEGDAGLWGLDPASVVGDWDDLGLFADEDKVYNFRSDNIVVSGNTHSGSASCRCCSLPDWCCMAAACTAARSGSFCSCSSAFSSW